MAKQPFDPAGDEFRSREALGQFPAGQLAHVVEKVEEVEGSTLWCAFCRCGGAYTAGSEGSARDTALWHVSGATDRSIMDVRAEDRRRQGEGLGVPAPAVGWVDEAQEMAPDLLGALSNSVTRARVGRKQRLWEQVEARHAREVAELTEFYRARYVAEGLEPPSEAEVSAALAAVPPHLRAPAAEYDVVDVQDLPPSQGSTSGPLIRPGEQPRPSWAQSAAWGELTFEFNPLTGDVKVTSSTGVLQSEPLVPGVMLLRAHRREGTPGVTS